MPHQVVWQRGSQSVGECLASHHDSLVNHVQADKRHAKWQGSPWTTTTLNMGPQVTDPHRDAGNLAYGLCAVTTIGQFDHRHGRGVG
jgi:hypothetical protein